MHVAPPSSPRPHIQELGDTLVVTFRARRSLGELLFLGFWLTLWTFGGIAALCALPGARWDGRVFLGVWLCGWAFGEALAALVIAWQLAGRELLTVTPHQLEVGRHLGRFAAPTRRVHVLAIEDVRVERVSTDEEQKLRAGFRLRIVSHGETRLLVGKGMEEHEAEYVASVVRSHVHPRRQWSSDKPEYGFARPANPVPAVPECQSPLEYAARERVWAAVLPRVAPALFGAILIALVVFVVLPLRHLPRLPRLSPPPASPVEPHPAAAVDYRTAAPPLRQQFNDPGAYAVAMTRYALVGAQTKVESAPRCDTTTTWTHWTCRARARSRNGPFAGRSLVYRCSAVGGQQTATAPGQEILCGPEHPPPITP